MPIGLMNVPAITQESINPFQNAIRQGIGTYADLQDALFKATRTKYAEPITLADVMSKMAYAQLVSPQAAVKFISNPAVQRLLPPDKLQNLAGGLANSLGQPPFLQQLMGQKGNGSNSNGMNLMSSDMMKNAFGSSDKNAQPSMPNLQQLPLSPEQIEKLKQMQMSSQANPQSAMGQYETPADQLQAQQGYPGAPGGYSALDVGAAQAEGLKERQKEIAKSDVKLMEGYEEAARTGDNKLVSLNQLSTLLSNPEFEAMRKIPIAGKYELKGYAKFGTPAQQEMVGQYNSLLGEIVREGAQDFKGSFRKGEQSLFTLIKPDPSDTVDAARGKTQALLLTTKMITERNRLAAELIRYKGISPVKAQDEADKKINGEALRKEIQNQLKSSFQSGKVTIRHKKTGETRTVSREEARQLGVGNV